MANKYLWDLTHSEKYTKDGEEKTKYTKVWALFYNEEYKTYSVNFLGTWLNVFSKDKEVKQENKQSKREDISIEDIPF